VFTESRFLALDFESPCISTVCEFFKMAERDDIGMMLDLETGVEFNAPPDKIWVISEAVFTSNHLTDTDK